MSLFNKIKFDLQEFRSRQVPTEEEIMADWEGDLDKPSVSVLCHTYNHKPYLEDALRGFLIQKTTFPFEVILHDDASTDGTTEIVREYAYRYPKIIKPVIQTDNQYSQGKKPSLLSFPHAKGDYIAMCEGDDFWIDKLKLKQQVSLLNENRSMMGVAHSAYVLEDGKKVKVINSYDEPVLDTRFLIRRGGGVVPTASLVMRREVHSELPIWFNQVPVGDYFLQVLAGKNGMLFLEEPLSVYRCNSISSVSKENRQLNTRDTLYQLERYLTSLDLLDSDLRFKYKQDIDFFRSSLLKEYSIIFLIEQGNDGLFRELIEKSNDVFVSINHRVIYLLRFFPKAIVYLYKLRRMTRKLMRENSVKLG